MSIEDLIKRPIESLPPQATCAEAARVMQCRGVGSVVVAQDERPIGIVTDRDLVLRVMAEGADPEVLHLEDVMSRMPVFVARGRGLDYVMEVMGDLAVRRVPIVDDDQRLLGLVSVDDVIVLLAKQLGVAARTIERELEAGRAAADEAG